MAAEETPRLWRAEDFRRERPEGWLPQPVRDEEGNLTAYRYEGAAADGGDVTFEVVRPCDVGRRAIGPDDLRARCFSGEFERLGARATFAASSWPEQSALQAARHWFREFPALVAEDRPAGLVLYGEVGVGKTWLACCLLNELCGKTVRCRMTTLRAVMDRISAAYGECGPTVAALARYGLVCLDDFGGERDTRTAREQAFAVVDGLEKRGVPIVATTNLTAAQLANGCERVDARVLDRLKGQAFSCVEVKGPNRRQLRARA